MSFSFRPPWWGIVLVVSSVSLFMKLGLWQWHRAQEKEQLLLQAKHHSTYETLTAHFLPPQYQRLQVKGNYELEHTFLLDNRFYQHRPGFEVLNLMKTESGRYLLVDRGWVPVTHDRRVLPTLPSLMLYSSHKGQAYYPSSKSWVLDNRVPPLSAEPTILQKVDTQQLSKLLGLELYPFMLRLNAKDPNALVREWQIVTMKPEKHRGYALQWFSFAAAALVIFFMLNVERKIHASR